MLRFRAVYPLRQKLSAQLFYTTQQERTEEGIPASPFTEGTNYELIGSYLHLKNLRNQNSVKGCITLKDVRKMMDLYRLSRDHPNRKEPTVASDVVNAILDTTRQREKVLRRVFTSERVDIITEQNEIMAAFLSEIIQDLLDNRSYLSTYAITYMITAFAALGRSNEIRALWDRLVDVSTSRPDLADHLRTPTVIGAALCQADPATMSLEFVEKTHKEASERYGTNFILEEALTIAYLRFESPQKAAERYVHMFNSLDIKKWMQSFTRLHNRILTENTDLEVGIAFLEMGLKADTHVRKLHPSAIGSFLRLCYHENHDFDELVDYFLRSANYYATRFSRLELRDISSLLTPVWSVFCEEYPQDTQKARDDFILLVKKIETIYPHPRSSLFFNMGFSSLIRQWPESPFLTELADKMAERSPLMADTARVILKARPSLETIEKIWEKRQEDISRLNKYDFQMLIHAANTEEKGIFVARAIKSAESDERISESVKAAGEFISANQFVKNVLDELSPPVPTANL